MLIVHRIVSAASLAGLARNQSVLLQAALLYECSAHHNYSRDVLESSEFWHMGQSAHKVTGAGIGTVWSQCYGHVNMAFKLLINQNVLCHADGGARKCSGEIVGGSLMAAVLPHPLHHDDITMAGWLAQAFRAFTQDD